MTFPARVKMKETHQVPQRPVLRLPLLRWGRHKVQKTEEEAAVTAEVCLRSSHLFSIFRSHTWV
jgi:hypothetical protein